LAAGLISFEASSECPIKTTMTNYAVSSHRRGFAWRGAWSERLLTLVRKKGFESVTAFVLDKPYATIPQLALEFGEGDVTPLQLTWRLVDEARDRGALRECSLDLLVRSIRGVEGGWPTDSSWEGQARVRIALVRWQSCLEEEQYSALMGRIVVALLDAADIPSAWQPSGISDPHLVSVFDQHWPQEQ
jgi:hypothetical protein